MNINVGKQMMLINLYRNINIYCLIMANLIILCVFKLAVFSRQLAI